jgi:hypothetical protein
LGQRDGGSIRNLSGCSAVGAGKGPKIVIERPILFNEKYDVLNFLNAFPRSGLRGSPLGDGFVGRVGMASG